MVVVAEVAVCEAVVVVEGFAVVVVVAVVVVLSLNVVVAISTIGSFWFDIVDVDSATLQAVKEMVNDTIKASAKYEPFFTKSFPFHIVCKAYANT